MSKTIRILVSVNLGLFFFAGSVSAQTVLYREVFPTEATSSCSGTKTSCQTDVVSDSWYAAQQGDTVDTGMATAQDLQQIPEGAPAVGGSGNELAAVNSGAADADGTTGAALYERSERFGVFLFTDEYSVASTSVGVVRFEARNDMADTVPLDVIDNMGNQSGPPVSLALSPTMRPAFCISNTWYVATTDGGQNTTSPSAWVSYEFPLAGLRFEVASAGASCLDLPSMPRTFNVPCVFMTNCGENAHMTVSALPSGTIEAFGIYWDKNWATDSTAPSGQRNVGTLGQVRIDNFELAGPLTVAEDCSGADLDNTEFFGGGGYLDPATDDFDMSTGTGCAEQSLDSVYCFNANNSCDVRVTCNSTSGTQSVNVFEDGMCNSAPALCLDSATGTGAVSVDVSLSAGQTTCAVCEFDGNGDDPRMSFTVLNGGDCGALPVQLESFSIEQ